VHSSVVPPIRVAATKPTQVAQATTAEPRLGVPSRRWWEFEGGVISGLFTATYGVGGPGEIMPWISITRPASSDATLFAGNAWFDPVEESLRKTQRVLSSAESTARQFTALLASGQITMRKVDGWQTLTLPADP
jgi:hypothetical protein